MRKELYPQFDLVVRFLKLSGVPILKKEGVEADDCIGNLVELLKRTNRIYIMSSDRDYYQLLSKNVSMLSPDSKSRNRYRLYGISSFVNEYGIKPKQWVDVGALMGDSSDTIVGIKGIGLKRALSLVKKYGGVKYLLGKRNALQGSTDCSKLIMDNRRLVKLAYRLKKIKRKGFLKSELDLSVKLPRITAMRKFQDVHLGDTYLYY